MPLASRHGLGKTGTKSVLTQLALTQQVLPMGVGWLQSHYPAGRALGENRAKQTKTIILVHRVHLNVLVRAFDFKIGPPTRRQGGALVGSLALAPQPA